MGGFVTFTGGVFGVLGAFLMFAGYAFGGDRRRHRLFEAGRYAMTAGGAALVLGGLAGWVGNNEFFGGLLMALFGQGAALMPAKSKPTAR